MPRARKGIKLKAVTKKRGPKPRSVAQEEAIIGVTRAYMWGRDEIQKHGGIFSLKGSTTGTGIKTGAQVKMRRNVSGATAEAEPALREKGLVKSRKGTPLTDQGTAARQAYYRAVKAHDARDAKPARKSVTSKS